MTPSRTLWEMPSAVSSTKKVLRQSSSSDLRSFGGSGRRESNPNPSQPERTGACVPHVGDTLICGDVHIHPRRVFTCYHRPPFTWPTFRQRTVRMRQILALVASVATKWGRRMSNTYAGTFRETLSPTWTQAYDNRLSTIRFVLIRQTKNPATNHVFPDKRHPLAYLWDCTR